MSSWPCSWEAGMPRRNGDQDQGAVARVGMGRKGAMEENWVKKKVVAVPPSPTQGLCVLKSSWWQWLFLMEPQGGYPGRGGNV